MKQNRLLLFTGLVCLMFCTFMGCSNHAKNLATVSSNYVTANPSPIVAENDQVTFDLTYEVPQRMVTENKTMIVELYLEWPGQCKKQLLDDWLIISDNVGKKMEKQYTEKVTVDSQGQPLSLMIKTYNRNERKDRMLGGWELDIAKVYPNQAAYQKSLED